MCTIVLTSKDSQNCDDELYPASTEVSLQRSIYRHSKDRADIILLFLLFHDNTKTKV